MEKIEAIGKTVDEAVQCALLTLGLSREQVDIEVIDQGSRGFLGLVGMRHARIAASPRAGAAKMATGGRTTDGAQPTCESANARAITTDHSGADQPDFQAGCAGACANGAVEFLEGLISVMELEATVTEREGDGVIQLDVEGKSLGVLIGRHGETLDAVQYLTNLAANRRSHSYGDGEHGARYIVDVAGYRKKREESLQAMAVERAEKALAEQKNQVLEPMSAMERRIVHMALQDMDGVTTHSEGREPYRRIVISPK